MEKTLQELIANVKTLVDAKGISDTEFKAINDQLTAFKAVSEDNANLKQQLSDLKDIVSTIEAKQKIESVVTKDEGTDEQAKTVVKEWLTSGRQISLKEFATEKVKNLNVGGSFDGTYPTYGGSVNHTVDRVLGSGIHEAAREASTVFNSLGRKTVSSTDYSELVLASYPNVGAQGEQMGSSNDTAAGVTNWNYTKTQTYKRVHLAVGKQYAKPLISNEAMNDPAIDVYAHLQQLLAREQAYYWEWMSLFGDGGTDNIRGILSSNRLKIGASGEAADSWRPTIDKYDAAGKLVTRSRDVEHFPTISFIESNLPLNPADKDDAPIVIDTLIDMETMLPSQYLGAAVWYMNRRTRGALKKIRNTNGDLILTSETTGGFSLLGYPVVVADFIPDWATSSTTTATESAFLIFGNLSQAAAIADIDENYLVDPYSVDGATQIKSEIRKGDIMQANDAIVVGVMAPTGTP